MPKISVIVPVYNTEKYLHRCIDSILAQTFSDFELLLINDGSRDKSGEICDKYALKDSRVRVFHKENGGVSSARNLGLDKAQGEWIVFVDADDYLYSRSFFLNLNSIEEDIVFTSHITEDVRGYEYFNIERNEQQNIVTFNDFVAKYINTNIIKTPWGKFFRKQKIEGKRFDTNIKVGEDFLFVLEYIKGIKTFNVLSDSYYCYIKGEQSLFQKYQQSIEQSIYTLTKLYEAYKSLQIINPMLERDLFFDYKCYCQDEIYRNPMGWYKNENVRCIYNEIKLILGLNYRIKYSFLSNELCSKIWSCIKRYING